MNRLNNYLVLFGLVGLGTGSMIALSAVTSGPSDAPEIDITTRPRTASMLPSAPVQPRQDRREQYDDVVIGRYVIEQPVTPKPKPEPEPIQRQPNLVLEYERRRNAVLKSHGMRDLATDYRPEPAPKPLRPLPPKQPKPPAQYARRLDRFEGMTTCYDRAIGYFYCRVR